MKKADDRIMLSNGTEIPCMGFGTWAIFDEDECADSVAKAIETGYRHVDTAYIYRNEKAVGKGIRKSGIKREDLFVTSKLWNDFWGYDSAKKAFENTLETMQLDYLDLYLIHWPANRENHPDDWEEINLSTWNALIDEYRKGRIKAIGVSNFLPEHLETLMKSEVKPMVNQIEYHPGYIQQSVTDYCNKNGIQLEAWSPMGRGRVLDLDVLGRLSEKYGKNPGQICLRFAVQNGVIPLPKSVREERMRGNIDIFDFELTEKEMDEIRNLPQYGYSGQDPADRYYGRPKDRFKK